MARRFHNTALLLLATDYRARHPGVIQDLRERGAVAGVDLEHAAHDVSALSGQEAEQAPGTFDDFGFLLGLWGREGV